MPSDQTSGRVALVVIAHSTYDHWEPLNHVGSAVRDLVRELSGTGSLYELHLPHLLDGGTKHDVEVALGTWIKGLTRDDRLVLYWTGHGTGNGSHYLVARDSPRRDLTPADAIAAETLGTIVAKSPAEKVLLLLDTCYSTAGAQQIAEIVGRIVSGRTGLPGQTRFIGVIPSSHSLQKAKEALFCRKLREVLTGADRKHRTWEDGDEWIRAGDLRDALFAAIAEEAGSAWLDPWAVFGGVGERFLPNPRFRRVAATDVETARRMLDVPDALIASGRGIEVHEGGWYFSGRSEVRTRLVKWLTEPGAGTAVLTGQPGSGKSAVLGYLSLLSHDRLRAQALGAGATRAGGDSAVPPPGAIDAAVHAKGKNASQCARLASSQLGFDLPSGDEQLSGERAFADQLRLLDRRVVLVVDALDESSDPAGVVAWVLRAADAGARVLVGSRRSPDGRVQLAGEDRHARLRQAFGPDTLLIDLDDEPATQQDIEGYVRMRLLDSRHRDDPEGIARAARRVAEQANGIFLYARIVARTLQEAERLDGDLPATPLDALTADIRERFGEGADRVNGLLAGLAWAEGEGVSRRMWPYLATAASPGQDFGPDDVTWVLEKAGWHILQTQEADQTVYRLIHQTFSDYYRQEAAAAFVVHQRFSLLAAGGFSGASWIDADGYLARHLATHAARGRVLDLFVHDPGYLSVADPVRLLPALSHVESDESRAIASVYRRAAVRLRGADPLERSSILHLMAVQESPALAARLTPLLTPRWRARWAHWRATIPSIAVPALTASVDVAGTARSPFGAFLLLAAGKLLRSIYMEHLSEMPARMLNDDITALASCNYGVEDLVIAATASGTITVMRLPSLEILHERSNAHAGSIRSMTVVADGEQLLLGTGGADGRVALWSLPELSPLAMRERVADPVLSVTAGSFERRPIVIAAGEAPDDRRNTHAPVSVLSVPGLKPIAELKSGQRVVHQVGFVNAGIEPVVLMSRYAAVSAVSLRTREDLPIAPEGEGVRSDYFIALSGKSTVSVALNAYGVHRNLMLEGRFPGAALHATRWVETGFGQWLGPLTVWNDRYLASVYQSEVRLWLLDDIDKAIASAPATTDEMFHLQKSYGLLSVAAMPGEVWCGSHAGTLLGWKANDGTPVPVRDRERPDLGESVGFATLPLPGRTLLIEGYSKGRIIVRAVGGARSRAIDIDVQGKLLALAVTRRGEGGLLAAATSTRVADEEPSFQVRLWQLPSGQEIPTRRTVDPEIEKLGFEIKGWELEVAGWQDKELSAVTFAESSDEGLLVLSGGYVRYIAGWRVDDREDEAVRLGLPHDAGHVKSLAARGGIVVAGTDRGVFIGWSSADWSLLWSVRAHRGGVRVAPIRTGNGEKFASGGEDATLKIWSVEGELEGSIPVGNDVPEAIEAISQLEDGGIAVATRRGIVVLDVT